MSSATETFTITAEQAELYEERFVPAIFAGWAPHTLDGVGLAAGQRLLDVACGTGIVARTAAAATGRPDDIVGVDLNEAMLQVARRVTPEITWMRGDAGRLPFSDGEFDAAICQAALMFLPDPTAAIREMARVVRRGGRVAVQVFDALADQPAYGPWVAMVARHAGPEAINLLQTYFVHGDRQVLAGRFADAGIEVTATTDRVGELRLPSIEAFVRVEIGATPLAQRLDETTLDQILAESEAVLASFRDGDGVRLPLGGYVISGAIG